MGRLSPLLPVFALLAAAALALAGCGGGGDAKLLPGTTAAEINSNLTLVEQQVAEEECIGAENSAAEIGTQVEELSGVDEKLKRALAEGASRLTENVAAECEEEPEEEVTVPTIEEAEEAEPDEKPKHEKPKDAEKEEPEEPETHEGPELPPQANGKGDEKGNGEGPPEEAPEEGPPPSGGIGPGTPAEGE